jgi:hypothetical protein
MQGAATALRDGDRVSILPALAGGSDTRRDGQGLDVAAR